MPEFGLPVLVKELANPVIEPKESGGAELVASFKDGAIGDDLVGSRAVLQNPEEPVDLALHGRAEQAGQEKKKPFKGKSRPTSEVFGMSPILIDKSIVIEGRFN